MADNDLSQLHAACNDAHARYRYARASLAKAIDKAPDHKAVSEIVDSTQEFGLNATLDRLKTRDPKVAEAVTQLVEAADALDLAVAARENALQAKEPNRERAYVDDGREFTLDLDAGTSTYLDDPDHPIKIAIEKMERLHDDHQVFRPTEVDDDGDDEDDRRKKSRHR
jgi:hypothetical protein